MPEIDFSVYCSCGNGLCRQTTVNGTNIEVEPCERCLKEARDGGYDKGYDDGQDTGHSEGYNEGFHDGQNSQQQKE